MKCLYIFNFFIYFFLFDILESFNLSYIPSFLIENILINNSRIYAHNLSFIKIINSSFYNCTYLNNLFKTNENYLLCIKNISTEFTDLNIYFIIILNI